MKNTKKLSMIMHGLMLINLTFVIMFSLMMPENYYVTKPDPYVEIGLVLNFLAFIFGAYLAAYWLGKSGT